MLIREKCFWILGVVAILGILFISGCVQKRAFRGTSPNISSEGEIFGHALTNCIDITSPGVYYLTADIINSSQSYCINISANNVTLDCQGHLIDGDDSADYGIYIYRDSEQITNITIRNCIMQDWDVANIYFKNADGNTIVNATSSSSPGEGIFLDSSDSNTLKNITANSNNVDGIYLENSNSNTLQEITANFNGYGISLANSNSNTLQNITANSNNRHGIYLGYNSNSNILQDITANSNGYGIYLHRFSNSNTLTNITANSNGIGICLWYVISNTLQDITANSNGIGIYLDSSGSNTLTNITANSNDYGILIRSSNSNTLTNSTIANNGEAGLSLDVVFYNSKNNKIYNCLFNNSVNVKIDSDITGENYFNTTKQLGTRIYSAGGYIGGNYWTNPTGNGYSDTCVDSNKDGFCDEPLNLSNGTSVAYDYLPLSDEYTTTTTTTLPPGLPPQESGSDAREARVENSIP